MASITDWMSAVGTSLAAGAAIVAAAAAVLAARYTKQAVTEAAKSSKAAADQVELQRPRPIVLATFSHSFKEHQTDDNPMREFHLENLGDSPAFDVEVSSMEVPDARNRLTTEALSHLKSGASHACKHRLEAPQSVLTVLRPAETFANELVSFFNASSTGTLTERIDKRCQIQFTLSYRALDERRFVQRYAFIVFFPKLRAWVEPVGSLLENAAMEPKMSTELILTPAVPRRGKQPRASI